jgi:transcriptional regulator with XRE-family HTH domain
VGRAPEAATSRGRSYVCTISLDKLGRRVYTFPKFFAKVFQDGYQGGVVISRYGEKLRELRAERRLSLRQVEERGGPNKDTMSLIERGVHKPHAQTLGRIAQAFDMSVAELRAELEAADRPPLGPASAEQRSFENHLREEQRGEWDAAVGRARQLREVGRTRMEEQLSAWLDSKERGETADVRRELRAEMGRLLQEAFDARSGLLANLQAGLAIRDPRLESARPGESFPNPGWKEVKEADSFYWTLRKMVEDIGLFIRTASTTQEGEPAQAGEPEAHSVEEPRAA